MKTKTIFAIALMVLGLGFSSCKKEVKEGCTNPIAMNYDSSAEEDDNSCQIKGCTDPDSDNYNASANVSDGSCSFTGYHVIWYNQDAATGLVNDGATSLTFIVDGQIVGSTATTQYWVSAPVCGDNASITITHDMGSLKDKSLSYSVEDQTGFVYWTGTIDLTANACNRTELAW